VAETGRSQLDAALAELLEAVAARVRSDPQEQVGLNELAWGAARREAALACLDWAERTGDGLAAMVAEAALDDALQRLSGGSAIGRIAGQASLAAVAADYRPLEDLGASDEHRLLRSACRDFAEREIHPHAQAIHRGDLDLPEPVIRGVSELGLFGISIPAEYGGSRGEQPDYEAMLIVTEELSRASLTAGGSLITRPEILVRALLDAGTDEQRRRWLPAIASGENDTRGCDVRLVFAFRSQWF